jgi:hypothetical protein
MANVLRYPYRLFGRFPATKPTMEADVVPAPVHAVHLRPGSEGGPLAAPALDGMKRGVARIRGATTVD